MTEAGGRELLRLEDITKVYGRGAGRVDALRGVSLSVRGGEMVLVMGPSGSGKTTLLTIMGCALKPTSGAVSIRGRDVTRLGEAALPSVRLAHIGFVFQGFNLFPQLTARENVSFVLGLKGQGRRERKAEASRLLEFVGLTHRADHLPEELSGGEKQRVAIARALAGGPSLILGDEPTAALDHETGATIMDLLRSVARDEGRAVVVVTHDPRVLPYADRVIEMEDGLLNGQ